MEFRLMRSEELHKFSDIDRREIIEKIYYYKNGTLDLVPEFYDVPEWTHDQKQGFIKSLKDLHGRGGMVFGAFNGETITGMASLDSRLLGPEGNQLNLAGLWVSKQHRNKGIASSLIEMVTKEAKKRGAVSLYVSATPSEHTIQFYKNRGFELAKHIDPVLFEMEPEDIHMERTI